MHGKQPPNSYLLLGQRHTPEAAQSVTQHLVYVTTLTSSPKLMFLVAIMQRPRPDLRSTLMLVVVDAISDC